jgi:1,4-alpha-glucan branching enzyme
MLSTLAFTVLSTGCGKQPASTNPPLTDGGHLLDAGSSDAGNHSDAGPAADAGTGTDAGPSDGGAITDAGPIPDAGPTPDAGAPIDAGPNDAGTPDSGPTDAGVNDAGPSDAGSSSTTFTVWAPNAVGVTATGDFGSVTLNEIDAGHWSGSATTSPGQAYHFVITMPDGGQLSRTDPRAFQVGADPGRQEPDGLIFDPSGFVWSSSYTAITPRHMVIYEMHVGTFNDPTGTGIGTFASAAQKLSDLAQLGITTVELLPVNEFPGNYSWGYNPTYPFAPCRAYGEPADLQSFVDQAHALGIGVILDVVFNHFSLDSRTTPSMSMWCFDGPCDGGGIYFNPEPTTPWGPRPAYATPDVHDYIIDAMESWLTNYHVDGFRWDSAYYTRTNGSNTTQLPEGARLLKDMNVAVHSLNPNVVTVAEDLQGWDAITEPVDGGVISTYSSGYGFDAQWDDGFFSTLKPILISNSDSQRDMPTLANVLNNMAPMTRVVYTEDHDKVATQNGATNERIPELIGSSQNYYYAKRRAGLGMAMVLTVPAVPMLFMGQEFLETETFPFTAGPALDWNNEQTFSGFRTMIHDLIAVRRNIAGNTYGLVANNFYLLQANNSHNGVVSPAIAFRRWAHGGPGDDVIVVANFSNQQLALPVGFPASGVWHVRFNSDDQTYSPDFGGTPSADVNTTATALDGQAQSGTVNLGPYSVVILSQG